jgi:hypothetical protein
MRHLILLFAIIVLAAPSAAFGKGPSAATVDGPGASITFRGCCAPDTPTMKLAEQAGFFPAVFDAGRPDPMLAERPGGNLGPRYTITYTVPGPAGKQWLIRQDLYPYAKPTPVTYTKPGQDIFAVPAGARGGWFKASRQLKATLVAAGLPETPPSPGAGGWSLRDLIVPALALLLVAAVLLRRAVRPPARMAGSPS